VLRVSNQTGDRPPTMGPVQVYRAQHGWHDRQPVHVPVPGTHHQSGDDRQRRPGTRVSTGLDEVAENGVGRFADDREEGSQRIAAVVHPRTGS